MKEKMKRNYIIALGILTLFFTVNLNADSFRYMDESGNIHWVDRITDVPTKYINQVMPPTPSYEIGSGKGRGDKKYQEALRKYEQDKRRFEEEKAERERAKIKEENMRLKALEKEKARNLKRKKGDPKGREKVSAKS